MAQRKVKVVVSGKVQGVWFRAWTQETAQKLGLVGQVRNLPDRTVEAVLVGDESSVATMLEKFHEGSPQSEVTGVESEDLPELEVDETAFRIVR